MAGLTQTVPIGGISIGAPIVIGGGNVDASIYLEREVFADTIFVIESAYPTVAWPEPAEVHVRPGSNTAPFTIKTNPVTESISVTFSGYSDSGVLSPADEVVMEAAGPAEG